MLCHLSPSAGPSLFFPYPHVRLITLRHPRIFKGYCHLLGLENRLTDPQQPCGRPPLIGLSQSHDRQRTRKLSERRCFIIPCFCCQVRTVVTFLIGEGFRPMETSRGLGLGLATSARLPPTSQAVDQPAWPQLDQPSERAFCQRATTNRFENSA